MIFPSQLHAGLRNGRHQEATVDVPVNGQNVTVKLAVVFLHLFKCKILMDKVSKVERQTTTSSAMACPGGCIGARTAPACQCGSQAARTAAVYRVDETKTIHSLTRIQT